MSQLIQYEEMGDIAVEKPSNESLPTYFTEDKKLLISCFQEKKITAPMLVSELVPKFNTNLQELIYSENTPIQNRCMTFSIVASHPEKYINLFQSFNVSYEEEINSLQKFMENPENLKKFVEVPLNFYKWKELHITDFETQTNIASKSGRPKTLQLIEVVIEIAFDWCKSLHQKTYERFSMGNYGDKINALWEIKKEFVEFLNTGIYFDNILRPVRDIINEASNYDDKDFTFWKLMVTIYKRVLYISLKEELQKMFVEIIREILVLIVESNVDEEKLPYLMAEKKIQMLKEVMDYFIDMEVENHNIDSISSFNPMNKLKLTSLETSLKKIIKELIPKEPAKLNRFVEFTSVYSQFFCSLLFPQLVLPLINKLHSTTVKRFQKLGSSKEIIDNINLLNKQKKEWEDYYN